MTTNIKIKAHSHSVYVMVQDKGADGIYVMTHEEVLHPRDPEKVFYATTTRQISIVDLEKDDPVLLKFKASS